MATEAASSRDTGVDLARSLKTAAEERDLSVLSGAGRDLVYDSCVACINPSRNRREL